MRTEQTQEEITSQMKEILAQKNANEYRDLSKPSFKHKHFQQWRDRNEMKQTMKNILLDKKRQELKM